MSFILIPDCNAIKYVEENKSNTNENIHLVDRFNYVDTVKDFEGYLPFFQKWQFGDTIKQQIWASGVSNVLLQMIDCDGIVINTQVATVAISNFLINNVVYNILQFDTLIDPLIFSEGKFYYRLSYQKTNTTVRNYLISEPQEIVASLPNSVYINYKNSYNKFDTIFKTTFGGNFTQDFNIRLDGRVTNTEEEALLESYEDQRLNMTQLDAKPFQIQRFRLGDKQGVPEWIGHKINMLKSCDTIVIDGYQFTFIDKIEKKKVENYTRFSYEINARKTKIQYSQQFEAIQIPSLCGIITTELYTDLGTPTTFYVYDATWVNTPIMPMDVLMEYSVDLGITWQTVLNKVLNGTFTAGSYDIGGTTSQSHYLRVTPKCNPTDAGTADMFYFSTDYSSGFGVNNITATGFTVNAGFSTGVNYDLSIDGGANWQYLNITQSSFIETGLVSGTTYQIKRRMKSANGIVQILPQIVSVTTL